MAHRHGGTRHLREALEIGRRVDSVDDVARAYVNLIDAYTHSARFAEVRELADEGFAYAQARGLARSYGVACLCEGASALQRTGRWREAAALIQVALQFEVPGTPETFFQERCQ